MQTTAQQTESLTVSRASRMLDALRPIGRFMVHYVEMCVVMCLGTAGLSLLIFGSAARLGYTDLPHTHPVVTTLVIAFNLAVPMLAWMRFRGMGWCPTLEMAGASVVVGLGLIAAYWLGIIAAGSLLELQLNLACPVMLAVMLFRYRLYSADHHVHQPSTA